MLTSFQPKAFRNSVSFSSEQYIDAEIDDFEAGAFRHRRYRLLANVVTNCSISGGK
jgi:hypothetical protein